MCRICVSVLLVQISNNQIILKGLNFVWKDNSCCWKRSKYLPNYKDNEIQSNYDYHSIWVFIFLQISNISAIRLFIINELLQPTGSQNGNMFNIVHAVNPWCSKKGQCIIMRAGIQLRRTGLLSRSRAILWCLYNPRAARLGKLAGQICKIMSKSYPET